MACMTTFLGICLTTLQLTSGGVDIRDTPIHETASSYDGVERDISKFYIPKDPKAHLGGYAIINGDTKIDFNWDNGVNTDKLEVTNKHYVGITKAFVSENKKHLLTVGYGQTWGGDIHNEPCIDGIDREYYCGTLTAWSDYDDKEVDNPVEHTAQIRYIYKF